jgi:acetyltransferase-like isoleucine patch superfamily enzyme
MSDRRGTASDAAATSDNAIGVPKVMIALPKPVKDFLKKLGVHRLCAVWLAGWDSFPIVVTNFFFQRVIGINRSCPWSVHFTSRVIVPERMRIHPSVRKSFSLSGGCYFQGGSGIEIEEGTLIAPGVKIISANHSMEKLDQWDSAEPIRIGKNCWIGANAVILPGVQLGDHVIVGAGSVVTHSFEQGSVIAGVPARLLRRYEPGRCGVVEHTSHD